MTRYLALLGAFAAAAMAADSTTISMLLPGDPAPYVGSVVKVDQSVTTVVVKCKPGTPSEDCGAPEDGFTVAQGPSTWHYTQSYTGDDSGLYSMVAECKLDQSKASCHIAVTQDIDGKRTTQTTDTEDANYKTSMYPVVVTAGADQLGAAPGASATGGDSSQTATTAATGSQVTSLASKTDASKTDASKTGASASSTTGKNAAGPMITQNAILAGVVAVIGGAIAL